MQDICPILKMKGCRPVDALCDADCAWYGSHCGCTFLSILERIADALEAIAAEAGERAFRNGRG